MQGEDETTEPGAPHLLAGPPEARALAELAALVRFYANRLEQFVAEIRRDAEAAVSPNLRALVVRDLRELGRDFSRTADALSPRAAAEPPPAPDEKPDPT